ncbi:lipase 3-like [Pectinophora gossypiella]|uniref:lipase 3-like n=1 Tax=Pectinophora gossypiella TaxID=13191 RepID=UPI00214E75FE|nr:lipase 3-like [Pectinophora gossypiella]
MKAVCLIVFLTLARYSAGHIFRRQYYPQDSLIVQPLDYINQAQELYPGQQSQEDSRQNSNERNVKYQQSGRQNQKNRQQQQPEYGQQQEYRQQSEQSRQQPEYRQQNEQYQQPQYRQQNEQYQQPQYRQQGEQSRQNKQKHHQTRQTKQQVQQTHDSTSAESSQETRKIYSEYAMPVYADAGELNTRLYFGQPEMRPAYGDAVAWRGVEIAANANTPVDRQDIQKIFNEAYKTMKHVSQEDKKIFHQAYEQAAKTDNEDAHLNATQLLNKYQYAVDTHTIKTDDGYFLTLFRIQPKEQTLVQRPVVFLMHGLLGSADDWLLMGPGKSLAYLLADAGYEVWLGNARGSKYSRRHVSKHPAQADFWQYSTDEIALHDLPVMIDYVLKTSSQEKLYYVGYSQGTTAFFALAAARPEYNNKIIMMYALSPMAYMSNVRSPLLRMIAPTSAFYERLHEQLGHGEFKPSKELVNTFGGAMCETEIGCRNVCSNINFVMSGVGVENLDVELIPVIMQHLPAGASTRQIKQYAQAVAHNEFTKYDYGAEINQRVYGSAQPPKYNMQKVQTPVALYYSEEDWLAHPSDVERLAKELPNVKDLYKVQHYSNMDFQFSKNAPEMVYNRLIQSIQKQSNQQQNYGY